MKNVYDAINKIDKEKVSALLTESLPGLRAIIGVSQDEMACFLGMSRQSYSYIETGKRKMKWTTYMAIIMFFGYNDRTKNMILKIGCFPKELQEVLKVDKRAEIRNEIYGKSEPSRDI